ncbi:CehA/McbA family metallohydrolase [Paractinoplanes lichenicola]|uniref:CehA/McbA family metallohydrolase n=1 Tax=Paractinoplanes lichenicola TaxID=2802976 RepID=A0ABS1VSB5_9ACTN|nr:CehA/McbA family metallohydrolase [Actinoplanes lichenicola]MBL7257250.1 CehA/McbA family metallohydrolase [Actinoplanes lichenicola]
MTAHEHHHTHDHLTRRSLIAASGGLLVLAATPGSAQARTLNAPAARGASRASAISQGTALVHADLHNHTLMSDGDGDPANAFASMREAGLDVAALTDHTTLFAIEGLSSSEWRRAGQLADAANDPGVYTAIRGFEWSHPLLGHVNVWYSGNFTDLGSSSSMGKLYDFIEGSGGISGFNHPGREVLRFNDFSYDASLRDQMVGLEMFNRGDDYLFDGWSNGQSSPLNACLNAGWRTGLTGVTDEHGTNWGFPEGKGRTGLWVAENTRNGVLEAMRARRFFATRVSGLRLDATASGVRMGSSLPFARGDVRFSVDLDRGPEWAGKPLKLQVLRPGTRAPEVVEVIDTTAGRITEFTVPLDVEDGKWVVIRVSDPTQANASPGPSGHPCNDWGVAYSSPWWLTN